MKKPYLERVITRDGCGPLLFVLMAGVVFLLAAYFMHAWIVFGANIHF